VADFIERRVHWDCQSIGVCNERHDKEFERWQAVQTTLVGVERVGHTLSKVGFTILGGLVVALVLLALNLIIENKRISYIENPPALKSSPLKTP
jgi:hypothetical protein